MDLCGAVAWLESLGLVHGDLRPDNLLLDKGDHLKLVDFDCAEEIGTESLEARRRGLVYWDKKLADTKVRGASTGRRPSRSPLDLLYIQ